MPHDSLEHNDGILSSSRDIGPAPDRPLPALPEDTDRERAVSEAYTVQSLACLEGAVKPPRPPAWTVMEQLAFIDAASRGVERNVSASSSIESPASAPKNTFATETRTQHRGSEYRFPRLHDYSAASLAPRVSRAPPSTPMNWPSATQVATKEGQIKSEEPHESAVREARRNRTRARKLRDLPISTKSSCERVDDTRNDGTPAEAEHQTAQHEVVKDMQSNATRRSVGSSPQHAPVFRASHGITLSPPNSPHEPTASTSGVTSGESLMARSRSSQDLIVRVQALERENRLLQAALEAVLKTNGQVNGCPFVNHVDMSSTVSIDDSLERMRDLLVPSDRSSLTKETVVDSGRTSHLSTGSRHSYSRSGRSPSALDLYLATRRGNTQAARNSLQAALRSPSFPPEEKTGSGITETRRSRDVRRSNVAVDDATESVYEKAAA